MITCVAVQGTLVLIRKNPRNIHCPLFGDEQAHWLAIAMNSTTPHLTNHHVHVHRQTHTWERVLQALRSRFRTFELLVKLLKALHRFFVVAHRACSSPVDAVRRCHGVRGRGSLRNARMSASGSAVLHAWCECRRLALSLSLSLRLVIVDGLAPGCPVDLLVAPRSTATQDGAHPDSDEVVCVAADARLDAWAARVEGDHFADAGLFESHRLDVHAVQHGKDAALDVECGQSLVGRWFEPVAKDAEDVLVQRNQFQVGSARFIRQRTAYSNEDRESGMKKKKGKHTFAMWPPHEAAS